MGLDIRLPIGIFFTALGVLLASFGAWSPPNIYMQSLGINVNLVWGIVLLGFGVAMMVAAMFSRKKYRQRAQAKREAPETTR